MSDRKSRRRRGKRPVIDNTQEASTSSTKGEEKKVERRAPLDLDADEEVEFEIDAKDKPFNATLFGKTLQKGFSQLYNMPC